jgi:pyruvate/2-oxoglutarate dehydrogenase complex dihydrolipoamide acyltransferase (E2) component
MPLTTHLVCVPEELTGLVEVRAWLAEPGMVLEPDAPLVQLSNGRDVWTVGMPMAGQLLERCVSPGERIAASELLAMIEVDEPEFGLLPTPEAAGPAAWPQASTPSSVRQRLAPADDAPAALALCAALGLAPDDVPGPFSLASVHRHVRAELRRLAAVRAVLGEVD